MINFHGAGKKSSFFEGWYLKHQGPGGVLAVIPAWHVDREGNPSASIQVVTGEETWSVPFPAESFRAAKRALAVRVGDCRFSASGMELSLRAPGLSLKGRVDYGPFTPLKSDIMGPFRHVPGMQCSHGVLSLSHRLTGSVSLNGRVVDFSGGLGYLEKDWGRSFPRSYLWTQCVWTEGCVMASAADIPFGPGHFPGCIGAVWFQGEEYRLATYRGVRIEHWGEDLLRLRQGELRLEARLLEAKPLRLRAPDLGGMTRTIDESPACRVRYRFWRGKKLLFDRIGENAGFETG